MKICTLCNKELSLEYFKKSSRRKDGRDSRCKKCHVQDTLARRKRDKGIIKTKPEYLIKHCKVHGDLKYEDIGLIIYSSTNPISVDMTCLQCKTENQKRKYNDKKYIENIHNKIIKCYSCNKKKHVSYFYTSELKRKSPACQDCIKMKQKSSKHKHILKSRFNITLEKFNEILNSQNGVCKICLKPEIRRHRITKEVTRLSIDHNHKTGEVRGLLCRSCNLMIGNANDSIEILLAGIKYLES